MARRKKHEEHENHERWLVSYADFITLLFAFFVVMYAISSVNEGKYRTLAHSLVAAFQTPSRSLQPVQVGELARTRNQAPLAVDQVPRNMQLPEHMTLPDADGDAPDSLRQMGERLVEALRPLIETGAVTVRRTELWLEVEINTSILFPSGSAVLGGEARGVLEQIAAVLVAFPNPIHVEGFTDDVPINTRDFGSNWELSAARAVRVVRLFADAGIEPTRMAAVGFGQYRPVADNATPEGRNKNRRVALVVLAEPDSRYKMDIVRDSSEIRLREESAPGGQP